MMWYKGQGLGNDYLAIDGNAFPLELTPPMVRLACDRHAGFGADGILVRLPSEVADFGVRIYNPDGSEAEKSGNGLRIFAAYLLEQGAVAPRTRFTVETAGGVVGLEILDVADHGVFHIEAQMGRASFRSAAVGLPGPDREVDGEQLQLPGGDRVAIQTVSMGNPHCVCFEDELVLEDLRRRAPQIATHEWFPRGTNVQFATAVGPDEVQAFVWERGAGETRSSGSSACAVAAAAVRRGLVQSRQVRVRMPGGTFEVSVGTDWDIVLRGPVESVFRARASTGLQRRMEELS